MSEMSESELLALVNEAEHDAVRYSGEWMAENEDYLKRYFRYQYGDEMEGQSSVVASDVPDVVESDMPSHVRTFLGSKNIMQFEPASASERDKQEAKEKTIYINHIVRHQPDSFKVIHDWMKDAEIQKLGVVNFGYEENEKTELIEFDNLDDDEMSLLDIELNLQAEQGIKIEYVGQDTNEDGTHYIKVRKTWMDKQFFVRGIPTEDFIISRNASSEDDAEIVGHQAKVTKGELIAAGYPVEMVKRLPSNDERDDQSNMKSLRFRSEGGEDESEDVNHWVNRLVDVSYLYMKVDYDGDNVAERRYIVKAGNQIIENEQFEMVPYAILSAVLMPHSAIGRGRAEFVTDHQRINTVLWRQILDNVYRVNNGRVVVNDDETNIDDLLTVRPNGIVRTTGDPRMAVAALETPYIGNQALQVVQYVDSLRAQTVGQQLANQGLEADRFHRETATRFEGVQDAAQAKIELVQRVFAETGFRKLYCGLAWFVSRYQNEKKEIQVLGKPMTIDPRKWMSANHVSCNVGLAAGDDEQTINNMASLLQIHTQLKASGSPLTDDKKIYNILERIIEAMGINRVNDYANNPEIPEELMMAQLEQAMAMNEQLMAVAEQNPLAEAQRIDAQAKLIAAEAKQETDVARLMEEQRQFNVKQQQDFAAKMAELEAKYTELELKYNTDIKGQGQGA